MSEQAYNNSQQTQNLIEIRSQEFIDILYCKYTQHGGDGLVEIRPVVYRGEARDSIFLLPEAINRSSSKIKALNRRCEIYFSVNPRPLSKRKKEDDIRDVICLWVDVDGKNFAGGKDEALQRLRDFPLTPNLIVDSGNGFHAYWIFSEPIINRTDEETLKLKQILSGLINVIGADKQRKNIDSVMRLPGTLNVKDAEHPKDCKVIEKHLERFFTLSDFDQYRDSEFTPQDDDTSINLDYEGTELLVSADNPHAAFADVKKLKVSSRIKGMIISGTLQTENGKDKTKSGRDQAIITSLVAAKYNFKTIKSIFFNRSLGCSNRIDGDSKKLIWDVKSAIKYLEKRKRNLSPSEKAIFDIENSELSAREKTRQVRAFIIRDLIKEDGCVGSGYKNKSENVCFFFDKDQKLLIDTDGEGFKYFLVNRYGLLDKDLREIVMGIQAAIDRDGEEIEPHVFAFYDKNSHLLYISNHANQIYKLDGSTIELVDNGTDGVIFEYRPDFVPFRIDEAKLREVTNYFEGGFRWTEFSSSDSLVLKHLIQRANFSTEETHGLSVEEQKYILTIYFFSLFFESLLGEKPILCFVGVRSSGKSLTVTIIGRILLGDGFLPNHLPDSGRDLKVMLSENYYTVFDNLDSGMSQYMDAFCAAATGAEISSRKLYTDREEIKSKPRVFIVITSREPKFKRDDFVDRLILLNTELIREPKSRSALFKEVADSRDMIMTEVLVNLNSIVRLLRRNSDWNPPCVFRIADWELLGKKMHRPNEQNRFVQILQKMNKAKSRFGLEDDPLYVLLKHEIYDQGEGLTDLSASQLYTFLLQVSDTLKMKDFSTRYKSSISLGRRLANINEELKNEFDFQVQTGRMRQKLYSIKKKGGEGGEDKP